MKLKGKIIIAVCVLAVLALVVYGFIVKSNVDDYFEEAGNGIYDFSKNLVYDRVQIKWDLREGIENIKNPIYNMFIKKCAESQFNGFVDKKDYLSAINTIEYIDECGIVVPSLQDGFLGMLNDMGWTSLSDIDIAAFIAAYSRLSVYKNDASDKLMVDYIESNFTPVITVNNKGGYYDEPADESGSTTENHDPLGISSSGGGVGTYNTSDGYERHGDIMIKTHSKTWAGFDEFDPNNEYQERYYFKDNLLKVFNNKYDGSDFKDALFSGKNYYNGDFIFNITTEFINVYGTHKEMSNDYYGINSFCGNIG